MHNIRDRNVWDTFANWNYQNLSKDLSHTGHSENRAIECSCLSLSDTEI